MTDRLFGTQNIAVTRDKDGKLVVVQRQQPPHLQSSTGNASKTAQQFLQAANAVDVGGTGHRWHAMKARFRPLFASNRIEAVEDWYNRIAPPRVKEKFRAAMKLLLAVPVERIGREHSNEVDPATWHRANHVLKLYGEVFAESSKDRVVAFLAHCSQDEADMFGDTMNSLLNALPVKSHMKSSWLSLERLADQPDRERFHRVIDWTSLTAAEKVRRGYINPMDTKRYGLEEKQKSKEEIEATLARVPTQLRVGGNKRTIGTLEALLQKAKEAGDEGAAEIGMVAEQLTKNKKSHLELSGGRYESDPVTGATVFQVKGQAMSMHLGGGASAPNKSSMKERIVAASGVPSHSWKSTTKDHFPNLSHGIIPGMGRVDPERHPCVARKTAATCMVVPSFAARVDVPVPSRGVKL